jgi:hypothetical protein
MSLGGFYIRAAHRVFISREQYKNPSKVGKTIDTLDTTWLLLLEVLV